jgi:Flp pilus assembly protein CpaB
LKRSNRLVLLLGIFLALVAFVLVAVTLRQKETPPPTASAAPTTTSVVVAAKDLALGTKITADAVTLKTVPLPAPPDSFADTSQVIGLTARQPVANGQLITSAVINSGGAVSDIQVPPGFVAIAVQVDQTTGVGTLIKPGDNVDVVMGITGPEKVPLVVFVPASPNPRSSAAPVGGTFKFDDNVKYNPTTVKTIVQGLQVLGTLLPPVNAAAPGASGEVNGGTSLNGQQEIVILAATTQQVEAIKFAQMDGTISLVLRSAKDCQASDGTASPCPIVTTTGITLRKMVDNYGVLPPQLVEVIEPTPYPQPKK